MSSTILVYYVKNTRPLEGSLNDFPPNQEIVAMWDITKRDSVSIEELREHCPANGEYARIMYISNN